ncbi:MAG: rhodanese-like domain-containing protein [Methanobacterium sp.]
MPKNNQNKSETITPQNALKMMEEHKDENQLVILDVRPKNEFELEHIPDAINLDYDGHEFKKKVSKIDKGKNYIIYCKSGVRGEYFMGIMKELGFPHVYNILGGFIGWKVSKLPLIK